MSYLRTRYGVPFGDEFLVADVSRYGRGSHIIQTPFTRPAERGGRAVAPCNPIVDKSCQPQPSGGGLSTSTQPAGGSMPPPAPNSGPGAGPTIGTHPTSPTTSTQPAGGSVPAPSSGGSATTPPKKRAGARRIFGGGGGGSGSGSPWPSTPAPGELRRVVTDLDGNSVPVTISPPATATKRWLLIAALVGGAYLLLSDKDGAP